MHSSHIKPSSSGSSSSHPNSSSSRTSNSNSNDAEADPRSVPARLSAGMMPYFIPPQPQAAQRHSSDDSHSPFDPTLMTPPMSPTESSFGFESSSTIEGRFSALPPSSNPQAFTPFDQKSPWTPVTNSSVHGSLSSSTSTTPLSVSGSTTGVSPRPLSFNWEQYDGFEDDEDQDDQDSNNEAEGDTQNQRSMTSKAPYHRQFEGHHSTVRRRPYLGREPSEERYDSLRHGIGLGVSDMSEELAKARSKMSRASRAMKSMEQELEAMQMSIGMGPSCSILFLFQHEVLLCLLIVSLMPYLSRPKQGIECFN
ncbi:hypothetical protein BC939DRAFT_442372 [Gamsiella multidivaricata]|uniref:uncharacterized protein n=1 Tax=Gamsiella multidivaricata TaxID=101098 RepID=UPI002220AFC2|nr:uncharacterized protein BC939DRAFT_442372 [Gamsiella multidivaricata]KAI7828958.1 hypothetical protein BC939DRAFT_442372 [Gamsiella multidivaricata]